MWSNRNIAGNLSAVASRVSEDTSVQDHTESQESFHDTDLTEWPAPAAALWIQLGHSAHGWSAPKETPGPAAVLPLCLWTAAPLQDTAQSPAPAPSLGAGKWYCCNLLSQCITKIWAYMDTSSPSPAATASVDTLAKLLGNLKDSLWRKALDFGLGQR